MNHRIVTTIILTLSSAALVLCGCAQLPSSPKKPHVAVTTSWIACAIKDVAGDRFEIVRLLPPGDCPGHFDLSPGTMKNLSRCSILFRFDFQKGLDTKLAGLTSRGLRVVSVAMPGGLCVPDRYLDACRQVARVLQKKYPALSGVFSSRLAELANRLSGLSAKTRAQIAAAGLEGKSVICSEHQAEFCRWLGLRVISEFCRAENMSSSGITNLIAASERSGVRLVVANLQEGRQAADSIAERLHATVVVFSNFPSMDSGQRRFDDLVLANLKSLLRGTKT
jgi:zinc transport system substrate-binding protein